MYIRKIAITLDFTINKLKLAIVPVKDTKNVFESLTQDSLGNEQERILVMIQAAMFLCADFHFSLTRFAVPMQFQFRRNVKIA